jgi:nucleoside-diphosphate-sugar epimerase
MKILVTGSKGYIAKKIINNFSSAEVEGINRDNFDLLDKNKADAFFKNNKFDIVIHTAIQGGTRLKPENEKTFYNNLKMFFNLYDNRKSFKKFISLGSGAEIHSKDSFYGFSKKIINDIILNTKNFFNVRVYGVFDHDEWDTRFIKSNILRYINKEEIIIHKDKFMDFFFMEDFLQIISNIVTGKENTNLIECCYNKKYKLSDIANIINSLDDHKVGININSPGDLDSPYTSNNNLNFKGKIRGIEKGIYKTYLALKNT